jgi:hypothetical protein
VARGVRGGEPPARRVGSMAGRGPARRGAASTEAGGAWPGVGCGRRGVSVRGAFGVTS